MNKVITGSIATISMLILVGVILQDISGSLGSIDYVDGNLFVVLLLGMLIVVLFHIGTSIGGSGGKL